MRLCHKSELSKYLFLSSLPIALRMRPDIRRSITDAVDTDSRLRGVHEQPGGSALMTWPASFATTAT